MEALLHFITHLGWIAVVAVIYAESGLLIGFFLPGDSLLFTAGFLASQGMPVPVNIHVFALILFIAAVLGDSTGYVFGQKVGRKLFDRKNSRLFRRENLERAEEFYKKHGSKTIVIARFVPIIRTFAPIVAGVSKMHYPTFLAFNVVGAALWAVGFTYLGYFAGQALTDYGVNIELAVIIIIVVSMLPIFIHAVSNHDRRVNLWEGTKRELRIVFGRDKKF